MMVTPAWFFAAAFCKQRRMGALGEGQRGPGWVFGISSFLTGSGD